jgi:hypothetical protein
LSGEKRDAYKSSGRDRKPLHELDRCTVEGEDCEEGKDAGAGELATPPAARHRQI